MKNQLIRNALSMHNLRQWELAEMMNINEFSLSRKMRKELPSEEQRKIVSLIEKHTAEKGATNV